MLLIHDYLLLPAYLRSLSVLMEARQRQTHISHLAHTQVLDQSRPNFPSWFHGAKLNMCFNALDRHVLAGRGAQVRSCMREVFSRCTPWPFRITAAHSSRPQAALIFDSPVTNTKLTLSYANLLAKVERFAGALANAHVQAGDRVVIYMPMVGGSMRCA
jgi:propionyl-CoA synthetase